MIIAREQIKGVFDGRNSGEFEFIRSTGHLGSTVGICGANS